LHFDALINPAVNLLLAEGQGVYRCERDLHHHLTLCLNVVTKLGLGRADRVIRYEEPTLAKYSWTKDNEKSGNVDFFFPTGAMSPLGPVGTAMEVNYNYRDSQKIMQDFVKLLDPSNGFGEAVYLAYGRSADFANLVAAGYQSATEWLSQHRMGFQSAGDIRVILIDHQRWLRVRVRVGRPHAEAIIWADAIEDTKLVPDAGDTEEVVAADHFVDREQARAVLIREMDAAGIPLPSVTARCMFEQTNNGKCRFGVTPLWDNELRLVDGRILLTEFTRWIQLLVRSGQSAQRAARGIQA